MFVVLKISSKPTKLRHKPRYVLEEGPVLAPAAVGFVDVLGMRELLRTRTLLNVANGIMATFVSRSIGAVKILLNDPASLAEVREQIDMRPANILTHLFVSDTLVIVCLVDPWERSLKKAAADAVWLLAMQVASLMALNASEGVWLRGAIAYGNCIVRPTDPVLLLGEPLIEASMWEKRQEWIGGMLTPSATVALSASKRHLRALEGTVREPLVRYEIPMKLGEPLLPTASIAINWCTPSYPFRNPAEFVAQLKEMSPARQDIKAKINNAIAFCEFMHAQHST